MVKKEKTVVELREAMERDRDRLNVIRTLFYQMETRSTVETYEFEQFSQGIQSRIGNDTRNSHIVENGDCDIELLLKDWRKKYSEHRFEYRFKKGGHIGFVLTTPGSHRMTEKELEEFGEIFEFVEDVFHEDERTYITYLITDKNGR